jgi:hypothetical protein
MLPGVSREASFPQPSIDETDPALLLPICVDPSQLTSDCAPLITGSGSLATFKAPQPSHLGISISSLGGALDRTVGFCEDEVYGGRRGGQWEAGIGRRKLDFRD